MPIVDDDARRALTAQHFSNKMDAIARLGGGIAVCFGELNWPTP